MTDSTNRDLTLSETAFDALRAELLRASTRMSCHQALDLADLLHTVIRMRRRRRGLMDIDRLLEAEAYFGCDKVDQRPSATPSPCP